MAKEIQNPSKEPMLLTEYVLLDTEAYYKENFDWTGGKLAKLIEFATDRHVRLLTTDIIKREVSSGFDDALKLAREQLAKHAVTLKNIEHEAVLASLDNHGSCHAKLNEKFEQFLKACRAIEIPLRVDLSDLFSKYFAKQPPFSSKKRSEFPDAAIIASLSAWLKERRARAYVVSSDPDMKAACEGNDALIHVSTVAEVLSHANASKETLTKLHDYLVDSEVLVDLIKDKLSHLPVTVRQRGIAPARISGQVNRVYHIGIFNVQVVERDGDVFECELGIEAQFSLWLKIERPSTDELFPMGMHSMEKHFTMDFSGQVTVRFNQERKADGEIENLYIGDHSIELGSDDLYY